jgi:chemotaxis protein methyltransferase CheR
LDCIALNTTDNLYKIFTKEILQVNVKLSVVLVFNFSLRKLQHLRDWNGYMISIKEKELNGLVDYVRNNFGINLEKKRKLIETRLENHLKELGYERYEDYLNHLFMNTSADEIKKLINRLTTNHTFFMRENSHFEYLKTVVLPQMEKILKDKDIRIWSAGCSSGEEPYTIAMTIDDYFTPKKSLWDTRILATDISEKALEKARKGIYTSESVSKLPGYWKTKHFKKCDNSSYEISNNIKNEVIFRSFNLMQDVFPFKKKFHIIFCRNVMIYFNSETKRNLIKKFFEYTEKGGYIFIGQSETLGSEANICNDNSCSGYRYIMPSVYKKL